MGSESATVIVFEKSPRWAPELERQFEGEETRVRACRSTADLRALRTKAEGELPSGPTAVVLDLDSDPAACLQYLGFRMEHDDDNPVLVMASESVADLEWPLRELGAVDVIVGHVSGDRLARSCRHALKGAGTLRVS